MAYVTIPSLASFPASKRDGDGLRSAPLDMQDLLKRYTVREVVLVSSTPPRLVCLSEAEGLRAGSVLRDVGIKTAHDTFKNKWLGPDEPDLHARLCIPIVGRTFWYKSSDLSGQAPQPSETRTSSCPV